MVLRNYGCLLGESCLDIRLRSRYGFCMVKLNLSVECEVEKVCSSFDFLHDQRRWFMVDQVKRSIHARFTTFHVKFHFKIIDTQKSL